MRTLYKFLKVGFVSTIFMQVGFAQKDNVGIGTTKPDQSAILDLSSTNKGLLMPRVTLQQRSSIQNPANGLIVYQTDMISGFYYFDGKDWKSVGAETAQNSVADSFNWGLLGNTGVTSANFIGTDAEPIRFKIAGSLVGILAADNFTFMGYESGMNNSGSTHNTAMGFRALKTNVSGIRNVAIGSQALQNNTNSDNVAIGFNALQSNVGGNNNVALGLSALRVNNGGSFNLGLAAGALENNLSGNNNVGIGYAAGYTNSTGSDNVAIGAYSLFSAGAISGNLAIGSEAGRNATGSNSIFIGKQAGYSETASDKLYIANSSTATPLVYGDFTTKYLAVGEVAAVDRAAATSGGYRLLVKGGMITEKIKVATAGTLDWADYVFDNDYKVMSLEAVEAFVKENKHLPNVPSTEEMMKNGNDLGKTDAKLLEKIEELTLYMIEMNKEIKALKKENDLLKK